jgi:hypothetical protein
MASSSHWRAVDFRQPPEQILEAKFLVLADFAPSAQAAAMMTFAKEP